MFAYLLDGLRFVCLEGSWTLKPHEAKTLNAAIDRLPADNAERARRQLSQRFFVERQSNGRIPCFRYYQVHGNNLLADPFHTGTHFINVRLKASSRNITAKCVLHEGVVFGLEFPKPQRFFKGNPVEVTAVSCDTAGFSYTDVLDRAEHGSGKID
ncbi:hypothetical protein [Roseibium sp.]|uniref:hypothetical protein n=1 Tax=Roseibium sp. TaxID=1936156 RepID=UPI003B50EE48